MRKETFEYINNNDEIIIMTKDQYERFTDMECECDDFIYIQKTDCTDKMWDNLLEFMSHEDREFEIKVTIKLVSHDAREDYSKKCIINVFNRQNLEYLKALADDTHTCKDVLAIYTIDTPAFELHGLCRPQNVGEAISEHISNSLVVY